MKNIRLHMLLILLTITQLCYINSFINSYINVHNKKIYSINSNHRNFLNMVMKKDSPAHKTYTKDSFDVEIVSSSSIDSQHITSIPNSNLPAPYNSIVSSDSDAIICELSIGNEILDVLYQEDNTLYIKDTSNNDRVKLSGIQKEDVIIEIKDYGSRSITKSIDGITKYFKLNSKAVLRIRRPIKLIDEQIKESLLVPYSRNVKLRRPLGLYVLGIEKGSEKAGVYISAMKPGLGASKSKRLEIGDQIVAISASWGDRMWDISSVQSFILGVEMRTFSDMFVTIQRFVPLTSPLLLNQKSYSNMANKLANSDMFMDSDVTDVIEKISNVQQLKQVYDRIISMKDNEAIFNAQVINRLMSAAIKIEQLQFATDMFESIFDFNINTTTSGDVLNILSNADEIETGFVRGKVTENKFDTKKISKFPKEGPSLEPNEFVCTTAVKAYGRKKDVPKALALLPYLESKGLNPDIYFFTSLLYTLGKAGMVPEAEQLFW